VAATLLIGPAFALRLHGSRVAAEAALLALLAFAVAALLTAFHAPPTYPPVAPGLWLAASIALVGWLIAGGPRTEESTPAAAYETSPRSVEEPPVAPGLDPAAERIAHAAHELRTPLNHIIGFSDMIKNEVFGPIDNRYQEYAGIVVESAQRMLGTVNAYLDASKAAATGYEIQKVSLDFAPLADSAAEAARILARDKSQTVRLVLDERPLQVQADPRALRQILDNLLANAVKFGPCESIIELKIRRRGAKLVIEVEDEGPGMSEAERRGLGRAFVQGAAAEGQQGTGLGLMLVRQLVEAHGGTLDLLNAPGGGALVRVVAPVLEA
jgi:signal transduction histidine kinase